jgi:HAD superfamily hydrolase (TIGR01509 family)
MPNPTIDAVLFDADGVLQRSTIDWRTSLGAFAGTNGTADDFIRDVMTSESPALVGDGDFADILAKVLTRQGSQAAVADVLDLWRQFKAEPEVVEIIQDLRAGGIECDLATNQRADRRAIMQDELHYGDWFDHTFYSADLGVAKPDPAYFRIILDTIGLPAESVLFIDDNQANVTAARTVGLHAEEFELETGVAMLRDLLRSYKLPIRD